MSKYKLTQWTHAHTHTHIHAPTQIYTHVRCLCCLTQRYHAPCLCVCLKTVGGLIFQLGAGWRSLRRWMILSHHMDLREKRKITKETLWTFELLIALHPVMFARYQQHGFCVMFRSCYKCFAGLQEQILWYQGNKNKQQTSENVSFTPHSHLSIILSLYIFLPASLPPRASFIPLRNQKPFLGLSMQRHTNTRKCHLHAMADIWASTEHEGKKRKEIQSTYFILLVRISWVCSAAVILAKWIKYVVLECHHRPSSFFFSLVLSALWKKIPLFCSLFFNADSLTAARNLVMPDGSIYACDNQADCSSLSLQ